MNSFDLSVALRQFTGTTNWYTSPLYPWMKYTDGIKFVAETVGAYWLLTILGTELQELNESEPFLHIILYVEEDGAEIVAGDGNGEFDLYRRKIDVTDFPVGEWTFYLINGVLILPSEY